MLSNMLDIEGIMGTMPDTTDMPMDMLDIKDMRVVWSLYFFHSATVNTEQGAFWTLMGADPEWAEKMYSIPPRALNCRHQAIECAGTPGMVGRVYYHPGDFM